VEKFDSDLYYKLRIDLHKQREYVEKCYPIGTYVEISHLHVLKHPQGETVFMISGYNRNGSNDAILILDGFESKYNHNTMWPGYVRPSVSENRKQTLSSILDE